MADWSGLRSGLLHVWLVLSQDGPTKDSFHGHWLSRTATLNVRGQDVVLKVSSLRSILQSLGQQGPDPSSKELS